jgi:UDP-N-acetylglucosamine 4,6-dehydratase
MQAGASVLITGGTGSFGQAFTERLLSDGWATRICIYSRGEHAQAAMRLKFGDSPCLRFFVGDVRDRWRLCRAMDGCDVVVHAAALKRIEVGYYNPSEMVQTNVLGAMNVIEAARDAKVKKVVALSTDKACEPVSPYGYSKAIAESLFLAADHSAVRNGPRFARVRYGNVWGSAGSVAPTWSQQLEDGSEFIRVTDPDCTRFFMRMDQATGLVDETIDTMKGGELNVPELDAYRVGDLAEVMIEGTGAKIVVTGLPEWEKKHESMLPGRSSDRARRMTTDELRAAL